MYRAQARSRGSGGGRYEEAPPPLRRRGLDDVGAAGAGLYRAARPAGAGEPRLSTRAFFLAARSSNQIVIGAATNHVEYVPEMMPTSMAAAKSKSVPTPYMNSPMSESAVANEVKVGRGSR